MKSRWLPTMPLHAAHWLADPKIQMLPPASRSDLLEALLRSWMLGKSVAVNPEIADAYADLWPELNAARLEHEELREMRAELGRLGNKKRWSDRNSDRNSDPNSDRRAIANASQKRSLGESPSDRTPTPTVTTAVTATASLETEAAALETDESGVVRRRTRRRPVSLRLDAKMIEIAAALGLTASEIEREWAKQGDHEYGTPRSDWPAAWRNWVRGALERRGSSRPAAEARQNVPPPAAPDPEFRARYEASMRRRRAPRCAPESAGATIAEVSTEGSHDPYDAPLIDDLMEA